MAPPSTGAGFVPQAQQGTAGYNPQHPVDPSLGANPNMVAQEANGMVYYYDPSQMAPVNNYPPYSAPQGYQAGVMGMGGIVTPSPDGYYYPQAAPNMVYYSH